VGRLSNLYISRCYDRRFDIKIQAASVDTGSGMKNGKLKGKDFFDVEQNPVITSKANELSGLSWT
jgi:polyisoprenoid-binding protein YceI